MVDVVIVGADRVTAQGDVCNKIGTYLKALAAHDNRVPFYVAVPSPSIDFTIVEGAVIPIEQRGADEVATMTGKTDGRTRRRSCPTAPVANFARRHAGAACHRLDYRTRRHRRSRAALTQTFPERRSPAN
jgi:methylthioribose-1-phosphate isomerase